MVIKTDAHAINQSTDFFRQPIAKTEVDVGIEGGCDLAGVFQRLGLRHFCRHVIFFGVSLDRLDHLVIENELIDQRLLARELEGANLDIQPRIHFFDDAIDAALEIPAHAG